MYQEDYIMRLIRSGFDREEIEEGVKSVCRMFGLAGLTDAFKIY